MLFGRRYTACRATGCTVRAAHVACPGGGMESLRARKGVGLTPARRDQLADSDFKVRHGNKSAA